MCEILCPDDSISTGTKVLEVVRWCLSSSVNIQLLYEVERQIKDQALSFEDTAKLRTRLAYPILVRFEKWLVAEHAKVIKGSPIEKAIMYTYKRFNKLSRYHLDGAYNIDNNDIENAVRPVAVGRKNYLFCQNDDTAESTAIIYSFMGCCKAAGVDFRKWMIYFLDMCMITMKTTLWI